MPDYEDIMSGALGGAFLPVDEESSEPLPVGQEGSDYTVESVEPFPGAEPPSMGPQIINFDVGNPNLTPEQRARERYAYSEAIGNLSGKPGASLTTDALQRAASITQEMRDPRLSSRDLMALHNELRSLDVGYSPQQVRRIESLNYQQTLLDQQLASGQVGRAQHFATSNSLQAMIEAVRPQRVPQKKSPWPPGQGVGESWTDEGGNQVTRNNKGDVVVKTHYAQTPMGVFQKEFSEQHKELQKQKNKDGEHLSQDEIDKRLNAFTDSWLKNRIKMETMMGLTKERGIQQSAREHGVPVDSMRSFVNSGEALSRRTQAEEQKGSFVASLNGAADDPIKLDAKVKELLGGAKTINDVKDPAKRQQIAALVQRIRQLKKK